MHQRMPLLPPWRRQGGAAAAGNCTVMLSPACPTCQHTLPSAEGAVPPRTAPPGSRRSIMAACSTTHSSSSCKPPPPPALPPAFPFLPTGALLAEAETVSGAEPSCVLPAELRAL